MPLISPTGRLGVLRNRNLAFYLSARFLATFAVQMQSVAIGWQVYQITGSLFDLGLIGLAQFAPFLVLILWAGHVADRYNRRLIVLCCMAVQLLCSAMLIAFTASGSTTVWPVFAILVLFGSARAFMMPASQAVLKNLVPDRDFSQAVALGSSTMHVAMILGPIVGGLLYVLGPQTVHMTSASLLALAVLLMTNTRTIAQVINKAPVSWHTLLEGLRFVRAGRDFTRPVRGAVRWSDRPAAGLRARHPGRRAVRPGLSAHGAGHGRGPVLGGAGDVSDHAPRRRLDVRRRCPVRPVRDRAGSD